jgi:imidazolonepropionase-like amidohydrolase
MAIALTLLAALIRPGAAAAPSAQVAASPVLVFSGATLIDGTGKAPLANAVVVIEGDRIRAVGSRDSVRIPQGARVIDVTGRTILPGLADLHTHLQGGWDGEAADMLNFGRYLDALLYGGVTTILDPGNSMPYVTQIKQEIAAGRLRGPRVYCAGPMIDSGDPMWPPLAEPLTSYGQVPRLVKRLVDNHVDVVKAYAGLSDLHVRALADEARKAGLRVIVDMWERNGSPSLVETGIYGFAHAPHAVTITDELAAAMKERGIGVITTIVVRESFAARRLQDLSFLEQPLVRDVIPAHFLDEMRTAARKGAFSLTGPPIAGYTREFELTKTNVLKLWRSGVLVAAGTDAPYPGVFQGEGIHRELELLVEAGLSPVEAIQAATGNAARFMDGSSADWGTVEPGKRADLLIVSGRPQERISDTRTVVDVVQAGRVLDRQALKIRPGEPAYRTSGSTFHPTAR